MGVFGRNRFVRFHVRTGPAHHTGPAKTSLLLGVDKRRPVGLELRNINVVPLGSGWGFLLSHIGPVPKVVCLMSLSVEAAVATGNDRRIELSGDDASGRDSRGSTLITMLIAGLVMIAVGAIVLMTFV